MSDFIIGYIVFLLTLRWLRDVWRTARDVNVVNVTYSRYMTKGACQYSSISEQES